MAKPVIILYITQPSWSTEHYKKAQVSYDNKFTDYHVLVVPSQRDEAVEIQVHNVKNLNSIGLKELKEKIVQSLPVSNPLKSVSE
jgi:hypothetical protein